MNDSPKVQVDDWIEREVAFGYCEWARVVAVMDSESVFVVYLDGDTPIQDEMIFHGGHWRFKHNGPSGNKVEFRAIKRWREILQEGPPHRILTGGQQPQLVYEQTNGAVWRLTKK
jgi:hypothetical protein